MPKITMPSISSSVITDRRTNNAATFIATLGQRCRSTRSYGLSRIDADFRSRREAQLAGRDDLVAGSETRRDHRFFAFGARDLDVAQLDGLIRLHDEHVLTVR